MTKDQPSSERRRLMQGGGLLLSGAAVALLAGCQTEAGAAQVSDQDTSQDADLLNAALALEYEGVFAYQAGAGTGLLTSQGVKLAELFLGHHERHRDLLIRTVERIGGQPVAPESDSVYADRLQLDLIASGADVLDLAFGLEQAAANAYIQVLPRFSDPLFGQFAARIAADEVMHWTTLAVILDKPLPEAALTFGAVT
ncbi:MAG: DUF4439 domain-containing protein [Pseudomonadota bacterium]